MIDAIRWFPVKSSLLRVFFMQADLLNLDTFYAIPYQPQVSKHSNKWKPGGLAEAPAIAGLHISLYDVAVFSRRVFQMEKNLNLISDECFYSPLPKCACILNERF